MNATILAAAAAEEHHVDHGLSLLIGVGVFGLLLLLLFITLQFDRNR